MFGKQSWFDKGQNRESGMGGENGSGWESESTGYAVERDGASEPSGGSFGK